MTWSVRCGYKRGQEAFITFTDSRVRRHGTLVKATYRKDIRVVREAEVRSKGKV